MLGVDRFLHTRGHFRRPVLIFMETFSQTELCLVKTVFLALPEGAVFSETHETEGGGEAGWRVGPMTLISEACRGEWFSDSCLSG